MIIAGKPLNERERLEALNALAILDTSSEQIFDDIVELAAEICDCPTALVSFVDQSRQWFKAKRGVDICESDRDISFCAHAILTENPLVIADAQLDDRFSDNPFVTQMNVRFYAGIPIVMSDIFRIGTLCVLDFRPKQITQTQIRYLQILTKQIEKHLESRMSEFHRLELQKSLEQHRLSLADSVKMAALGEMANGIAHEISNPLTTILAQSEQLIRLSEKNEFLPGKAKEIADKIERNGLRISKAIQLLRRYSSPEVGQSSAQNSLLKVLNEVFDMTREKFAKAQIDFTCQLPQLDIELDSEGSTISQILMSLLNNSFEAVIKENVKWVKCNCLVSENQIEISLMDSGPSVSPEIRVKMMKPFFTTKLSEKAPGLGLSIAERLAKAQGGSLKFDESQTNTCFILKLPITKKNKK